MLSSPPPVTCDSSESFMREWHSGINQDHLTVGNHRPVEARLIRRPFGGKAGETQSRRRGPMDLKELRDRALEATTRFFVDRDGILPDQEGEEWEAEYRRQYDIAKPMLQSRTAPRQRGAPRPAIRNGRDS